MTIDSFIIKQPLPLFTWPCCWSWINTGYNFRKMSFSLAQWSGLTQDTTCLPGQGNRTFGWLADILFLHERHMTHVATVLGVHSYDIISSCTNCFIQSYLVTWQGKKKGLTMATTSHFILLARAGGYFKRSVPLLFLSGNKSLLH